MPNQMKDDPVSRAARYLLLSVLLVLLTSNSPCRAFDDDFEDEPALKEQSGEKATGSPGGWVVSFYRDHISAVDGDRCPSVPTCSSYSMQAIRKHGFFIGWMMTVDRLIHEGREEAKVSPMVFSDGKWKIYDPVENNDFWWYENDRKPDD